MQYVYVCPHVLAYKAVMKALAWPVKLTNKIFHLHLPV